MRKLFRMKYEPCNGQCYAPDDVLRVNEFGLDATQAAMLLDRVIQIHEPACGNERLAYGLDHDESTGVFVASFQHYGTLDLYVDTSALGALNKLIDGALDWYASDEGKRLLAEQPGLGHDVCEHGKDHDLRHFALTYSGLDASTQATVFAARA